MSNWTGIWHNEPLSDAANSLEIEQITANGKTKLPLIQQVPISFRENKKFETYYLPKMFSFGPIHYGKRKLLFAEKLKLKLAHHFIKLNDISQPNLLQEIDTNLGWLKSCYDQHVINIRDEELAGMFLIDGCSSVHLIYCIVHDAKQVLMQERFLRLLGIKKDHEAFAQHDLFLLENQLPYHLMNMVITRADPGRSYRQAIMEFLRLNLMVIGEELPIKSFHDEDTSNVEDATILHVLEDEQPCHLLDLLRQRLIVKVKDERTQIGEISSYLSRVCSYVQKSVSRKLSSGIHGSAKREISDHGRHHEASMIHEWQSFRSVSELIASGVRFRPSKKLSLRNVCFQGFWFLATLKLPRLIVDDWTPPKLFNLVAYEMCPDFENDSEVISFVSLLDSLIDDKEDVKELRKAGILQNALGNDQEVANLFNEIAENLAANPEMYIYEIKRLESRYNSKIRTAVAQFIHNHFNSPWTFLALIGVLVGLGLSLIQTIYTVYPV